MFGWIKDGGETERGRFGGPDEIVKQSGRDYGPRNRPQDGHHSAEKPPLVTFLLSDNALVVKLGELDNDGRSKRSLQLVKAGMIHAPGNEEPDKRIDRAVDDSYAFVAALYMCEKSIVGAVIPDLERIVVTVRRTASPILHELVSRSVAFRVRKPLDSRVSRHTR
eukprot:scaffold45035_cov49-Attheya_sp.AAC.5